MNPFSIPEVLMRLLSYLLIYTLFWITLLAAGWAALWWL